MVGGEVVVGIGGADGEGDDAPFGRMLIAAWRAILCVVGAPECLVEDRGNVLLWAGRPSRRHEPIGRQTHSASSE